MLHDAKYYLKVQANLDYSAGVRLALHKSDCVSHVTLSHNAAYRRGITADIGGVSRR